MRCGKVLAGRGDLFSDMATVPADHYSQGLPIQLHITMLIIKR